MSLLKIQITYFINIILIWKKKTMQCREYYNGDCWLGKCKKTLNKWRSTKFKVLLSGIIWYHACTETLRRKKIQLNFTLQFNSVTTSVSSELPTKIREFASLPNGGFVAQFRKLRPTRIWEGWEGWDRFETRQSLNFFKQLSAITKIAVHLRGSHLCLSALLWRSYDFERNNDINSI